MDKIDDLQTAIRSEVSGSNSYLKSEISTQRREAMERYLGEPYGNEVEGRSAFVSTDVQDTIESLLPELMEVFASGDRIVRFDPRGGARDRAMAEQASDYVNYVWWVDNPGFENTYDWIKDALLQKNGYTKTYWDDSETSEEETYTDISVMQLEKILDDPDVEVLEQEEKEVPPEFADAAPDGVLYDLKIERTNRKGRVKVEVIPPEEFGTSRWSRSIYVAPLNYHKCEKTVSDLIEMGFDPQQIKDIPSDDEQLFNEERIARHAEESGIEADEEYQESMRKIWVYEVYIRYDWDGDDRAEMLQVFCAGSGLEILKNKGGEEAIERVDDHPFDTITPIRMPHRSYGRSAADLTMDIQLGKTTVQRQLFDNMYNQNNAMTAINEDVNLDDMLTKRPGGVVRVEGSGPPANAIFPMQSQQLGNYAFGLLEYLDTVRESRTGVTRYNQGMDANSLNDTATGINMILGQSQRRTMLIARLFANTGFKSVMLKILKLLIAHQDKERVIRLRDEWVPMDPRTWNAEMDVTITVGIGQGTQQAKQASLMGIMGLQQKAIDYQGGLEGPLVTLPQIYNSADQFCKSSGFANANMFFADPSTPEMEAVYEHKKNNPPPNPEMERVRLEDQREREKFQGEMQEKMGRLQHDRRRAEQAVQVQREKNASDADIARAELHLKEIELELEAAQSGQRLQIDRMTAETNRDTKQTEANIKVAGANRELLEREPELLSTALLDTVESLKAIAGPLAEAANRLTGGKQFVYNDAGDVIAVRHSDGTVQQVVRDTDGNMTGLSAVQ